MKTTTKEDGAAFDTLPILDTRDGDGLHGEHWSADLRAGARTVEDLVRLGFFSQEEAERVRSVTGSFQMLVSRYYLNLIDRDDPDCPIRLQALPSVEEGRTYPSDLADPIGDNDHSPVPGLVHRYADRVLFLPTYRCPMFCRYCFRKVALNGDPLRLRDILEPALNYVGQHSEIEEVILTGGDPLMLSDSRLGRLLNAFKSIPHIRKIRIHSRFVVTLPNRVNGDLVEILREGGVTRLVTHFNHPAEITEAAQRAISALLDAGIELCNQAVLLKGVNGDPDTLADLYSRLDALGVSPYYLHHLDAAPGTHHFRVTLEEGLAIYREACARMVVGSLPVYVLDLPGGLGKVPIDSATFERLDTRGQYAAISPVSGHTVTWTDPAWRIALAEGC